MTRRPHRRTTGLALVLCAALVTGGCTGDDEPGTAGTATSSATPQESVETVPTKVRVGTIAGDLPKAARKRTRAGVGKAVDRWLDAAFVDGEYPRSDFRDAYPRFTKGAKRQARREADLMSNADVGERIEGVEVTRRVIVVHAVADRRRAAGATARVRLRFTTVGDLEQDVTVKGRLFLTRAKKGWRIFGFDMTKGVR